MQISLISPAEQSERHLHQFVCEIFTKAFLDERVVCQRNALLSDLAVSALIDELTHRLQVGVPEGKKHTQVTLLHLMWSLLRARALSHTHTHFPFKKCLHLYSILPKLKCKKELCVTPRRCRAQRCAAC